MKITNLKVEYRAAPMGIGVARPRFSWQLKGEGEALKQNAYQIEIKKGQDRIWMSGKVEKDATFGIRPTVDLEPLTAYQWQVTVWTENAQLTAEASFETGVFSKEQWPCGWVTAKGPDGPMYYRSEFQIKAPIRKARFSMASTTGAHGNKAYIMNLLLVKLNGEKPNEDVFFPGQLSARKDRALFGRYDVTPLIKEGTNVLTAVALSAAWSAFLEVEYTDGTTEHIGFDAKNLQQTAEGPYTLWNPLTIDEGGKTETYDTRKEHRGWEQEGFDMSEWLPATPADGVGVLSEQISPAVVAEEKSPVSMWKNSHSRWVADFGENLHGFVKLKLNETNTKRKIAVRYAEERYPSGELNPRSTVNFSCGELAAQADQYVPRDKGEEEVFAPSFANHGFRYAEIVRHMGGAPETEAVRACVVHSPVLNESSFVCSDPQINRLYEISRRSQRMTMVTIPMDCPHRERLGWLGDALCVVESACLNYDVLNLMDHYMQTIADDQAEDGNVGYISPRPDYSGEGTDIPWAAACVMLPWTLYDVYGDPAILEKYFPTMERWLSFLEKTYLGVDGLMHGGVRWNDHTAKEKPDDDMIGTLYYYQGLFYTAKAAAVLGKEDRYSKRIRETKDALVKAYWNGAGFGNNYQSENAHALNLGLAQGEKESVVLGALLSKLKKDEGLLTCGCLGVYHLIPALAERGYNEQIFALCKDTRNGSWGGWVANYDATTSFEYLDATLGGSRNHPFLMGSINTWFYEHLLGIKRTAPGHKRFRVRPYFAQGVTYAEGTVDTLYGPIRFRWEKTEQAVSYRLEIPCGTEAEVFLPDGGVKSIGSGIYLF